MRRPFPKTRYETLIRGEGQQRDVARALDGYHQHTLVVGAHAAGAAGQHLAALGCEALECLHILVVDEGGFLSLLCEHDSIDSTNTAESIVFL